MTDTNPLQEESQPAIVAVNGNVPSTSNNSSPDIVTLKRKKNSDNEKDGEDTNDIHKRPKLVSDESSPNGTTAYAVTVDDPTATNSTNTVVTPVGSKETTSTTTTTAVAATVTNTTSAATPKSAEADTVTLDLAETLGLQVGAQIEVQWEIHNDAPEDDDNDNDENNNNNNTNTDTNTDTPQSAGEGAADAAAAAAPNESQSQPSMSLHWWKATLLPPDGRTTDSVAVRTLLYEARPDLGFPEPSREDVVFLGKDVLATSRTTDAADWDADPGSVHQMPYRQLSGTPDEVLFYNDDELETQLNGVLMGAVQKNKAAWNAVPAAQQAVIAEMIRAKKDELKTILRREARHKVITPEAIQDILARAF